jgi:hypothetical protein
MARIYPLSPLPQYLLDMVDQVLRIRDYYELATARPDVDQHPDNVMLPEQYDALMNVIKFDWYRMARASINDIRGIRNAIPAFAIDDILPPEPDPVDDYYSDPGYWYRTKDPNPHTPGLPPDFSPAPEPMMAIPGGMGVVPMGIWPGPRPKPRPPFPPFPPPGPIWPPLYWRPPAEETFSYCYRLNELVDYYVGDQSITQLEFQYWGYFLAELLKNVYWISSFWQTPEAVRLYFLPWGALLEQALPTR